MHCLISWVFLLHNIHSTANDSYLIYNFNEVVLEKKIQQKLFFQLTLGHYSSLFIKSEVRDM